MRGPWRLRGKPRYRRHHFATQLDPSPLLTYFDVDGPPSILFSTPPSDELLVMMLRGSEAMTALFQRAVSDARIAS